MSAVFAELSLKRMTIAEGALRQELAALQLELTPLQRRRQAVALRADAPIFVEDRVIDNAKTVDFAPEKGDAERLQKWLESLDPEELVGFMGHGRDRRGHGHRHGVRVRDQLGFLFALCRRCIRQRTGRRGDLRVRTRKRVPGHPAFWLEPG